MHGGDDTAKVHSALRVGSVELLQLLLAQLQEGIIVLKMIEVKVMQRFRYTYIDLKTNRGENVLFTRHCASLALH